MKQLTLQMPEQTGYISQMRGNDKRYKIEINPAYEKIRGLIAKLPAVFERQGVLVENGDATVKRYSLPLGRFTVRRFPARERRFWFRRPLSAAEEAWRNYWDGVAGAQKKTEAIAFIDESDAQGRPQYSYYITRL